MFKIVYTAALVLFSIGRPLSSVALELDMTKQCQALKNIDFSEIQDAPTQITEAEIVKASSNLPSHCRAQGFIAPEIGIELLLPTSNWNGKFLKVGCGGYCGQIWSSSCGDALRKGYSCIASDMGHQYGLRRRGLWAYNNFQAEIDYGFRATHVATLAGKAITKYFYDSAPKKSYYVGCSTGGRQGLVEAQRFPWDFDGIVAGAPAINLSATLLNIYWASLAANDKNGKPLFSFDELKLVHKAVLAECDTDDGIKDGVISNPTACRFDPAELVCAASTKGECLSKAQAEAINKIYTGPTTSQGKQIYTDGAMRGSELSFIKHLGESLFTRDFFRYLAFLPDPGSTWRRGSFNFDRDYQRFGMMESFYGGTNPDLRRFKANGGKLILYHGWADAGRGGIAPLKTVDYYETVEKTMGGRIETENFLRLFMIPGMGHCGGGPGPNVFDFLSHLEDWVEKGEAPDKIIGAHFDMDKYRESHPNGNHSDYLKFMSDPENKVFTRPVYPYPAWAKYKGRGDSSKAENFIPAWNN